MTQSDTRTGTQPQDKFEKRVGSFSLGTGISRVFGLVRESVFAYLFGAGFASDAFNAAFRIPNLLRDLFAESALSAAFVPVFVDKLVKDKKEDVWRFANNLLNGLLLVVGLLTVVGIIFSPALTRVITWGFERIPGKLDLTSSLTQVIFPFLIFVSLAAWTMGILNSSGSFFIPGIAPALFNVGSIVCAVLLYGYLGRIGVPPIYGMAIGVTVGGLLQFLVQLPSVFKRGYRYKPYLNFKDPAMRRVLSLWGPVALGYAAQRINVLVNMFMASLLAQASLTYLNYAYRLMHLPVGLFGVAVGTVSLPEFSKAAAENRLDSLKTSLVRAMNTASLLTIPTSVLLIVLALPITRLVYERGNFNFVNSLNTSAGLILYSLGIWALAETRNLANSFYALKDARTPTYVGLGSVVLNAGLNYSLMWKFGFKALALGTSVSALFNCFLLMYLLHRRIGDWGARKVLLQMIKLLFLSAIAGGIAFGLSWLLKLSLPQTGSVRLLVGVVVSGTAGLGAFYLAARIFRISEVSEFLKKFKR